ncbi:MAG: HypC/HybG/HupF family hydrogenase formation chaperone [Myxococcota bacterium]
MCLGIPGEIVEVLDEHGHVGKVDIGGVRRDVNLMLVVDENQPIEDLVGTWVLVHVGFAMARIDPDEAQRTLDLLNEMGEVQAELDAMRDSPRRNRSPYG